MEKLTPDHPMYGRVFSNTPRPGHPEDVQPNPDMVHLANFRETMQKLIASETPTWIEDLKKLSPAELALRLDDPDFKRRCDSYRP